MAYATCITPHPATRRPHPWALSPGPLWPEWDDLLPCRLPRKRASEEGPWPWPWPSGVPGEASTKHTSRLLSPPVSCIARSTCRSEVASQLAARNKTSTSNRPLTRLASHLIGAGLARGFPPRVCSVGSASPVHSVKRLERQCARVDEYPSVLVVSLGCGVFAAQGVELRPCGCVVNYE
jgi:hypothetical protein